MTWYEKLAERWHKRIKSTSFSRKALAKAANISMLHATAMYAYVRREEVPPPWMPDPHVNGDASKDVKITSDDRGTVLSTTEIMSLDDLLASANVDLKAWRVQKWIANVWGNNRQVKAWLERHPVGIAQETLAPVRRKKAAKRLKLKKPDFPHIAVVGLSDFHWGKYSDAQENGESFSRDVAKRRLFSATVDVMEKVAMFGAPEHFLIPIGSDFFNIDTHMGTTTTGTPQDSDGTYAEILQSGFYLVENWIDQIRSIAPVELRLMSGNHDRNSGIALLLYLEALYRYCPDVTVHMDRTYRSYHRYGKNLIGLVHGDGVKRTKDLAGIMAHEAPGWSESPHRTIYTGHLHNELTETEFGVVRRQLPSLSGPDRWHAKGGYTTAPKSLPCYIHHKEKGVVAILYGMEEK